MAQTTMDAKHILPGTPAWTDHRKRGFVPPSHRDRQLLRSWARGGFKFLYATVAKRRAALRRELSGSHISLPGEVTPYTARLRKRIAEYNGWRD